MRSGDSCGLKLETEANPSTESRFGIRGITTVDRLPRRKERSRHVGLADMKTLEGLVSS